MFFLSSRRRQTRCALVTGVQTCALPILRGDTGIASTHYRQIPVETANRCAAASGLALVARLVRVIEIRAACPLEKIARRGRPVTKLAGCSGEERARKQGIVTPDALVRCQIAIADQCPDPEAAIGRVFDFVKIQPVDIDQVRRSEEQTSELKS